VTAFTHCNLRRDVEDTAPSFNIAPDVEARFSRDVLECEKGAVGYFRLAPNKRFPFAHRQKLQEETYVVIGGGGRMKIGDEIIDLAPLDAVRVVPEVGRALESGPDGLEYVVFGAPHTGPGDGEMVEGFWTE
jgi:mannose-6-phosphate isomerase-like protein (cupin superfamily)